MRLIGVFEVVRRIIGKAIVVVTKQDVLDAAGPFQLCAGQNAGCEAAAHAMHRVFRDSSTDTAILADAKKCLQ